MPKGKHGTVVQNFCQRKYFTGREYLSVTICRQEVFVWRKLEKDLILGYIRRSCQLSIFLGIQCDTKQLLQQRLGYYRRCSSFFGSSLIIEGELSFWLFSMEGCYAWNWDRNIMHFRAFVYLRSVQTKSTMIQLKWIVCVWSSYVGLICNWYMCWSWLLI